MLTDFFFLLTETALSINIESTQKYSHSIHINMSFVVALPYLSTLKYRQHGSRAPASALAH